MADPTILADGLLAAAGAFLRKAFCSFCSLVVVHMAISRIKERRRGGQPEGEVSMEAARQLARSGMRIQAIKMVRDVSGVDLREAYEIIKCMESERGPEL